MEGIVDKVFLLIWGIVMIGAETEVAAPVVAMLFGILTAALGNGKWDVRIRGAGAVLFVVGCFFLPELIFFLPVVFYDCAMERQLWWVFGAAVLLGGYYWNEFAGAQRGCIWGVSLAVAVLLARRSGRAEQLAKELIRLRDTSTELNLVLRGKNKDLLEKQDYEIHLATLRERNRIAREIHDNVGHMLSRSILQLGALSTIHKEEPVHGQLCSVNDTLNLAMNSIRESVHDLHDDSIDLRQVVLEATRDMKDKYQISIEYDMSPEVPRSVKYCFIATVKEGMSNILKHSDADRISVILREHPGFYQLMVEDNGRMAAKENHFSRNGEAGIKDQLYTAGSKEAGRGIGLENMRERVEALHGTFRIHTERGFMIFISIPKENRVGM